MKLVVVLSDLNYRGGEHYFINLSKGLIESGHTVYVVAARVGKNARTFPFGTKLFHPPKIINFLFLNNYLFILLSMPITLFLLMRAGKDVDVILTHDHIFSLVPSVIASKILKKRVAVTFFGGFTKPPRVEVKRIVSWLVWYITRWATSKCFVGIVLYKEGEELVKRYYGLKKAKTVLLGLDTDELRKGSSKPLSNTYELKQKKVILVVAALSRERNSGEALEVFSIVKRKFPESLLVFIGDGSDTYKQELKEKAARLGILGAVLFEGVVPEVDLYTWYARADIVLHTSKIIGFTVFEAAYMKKISVYRAKAQPYGGLFQRLNLGIAVKKNTPSALSDAIIKYFRAESSYATQIDKSYRLVKKKFSNKVFSKNILAAFFES